MSRARGDFVPAAGRHWLLPFYDPLLALLTGERRWRGEILESLEIKPGDIVVDVGCGTGTLAIMGKESEPRAEFIGIDLDPNALVRAARKATRRGVQVSFRRGFGDETARIVGEGRAAKAVTSLALHHMPREMQVRTIAAMRDALKPGGAIRIADFTAGHFGVTEDADLVCDLTTAGFENARIIKHFRVAFSYTVLVAAEKPGR